MRYEYRGEFSKSDPCHVPHWHDPDGSRLTIVEGDGATVYDEDGNAYLDFVSSLYCVNVGHDNQNLIDAIERQLERIPYVSSAKENDVRTAFADKLTEVAPDPLTEVVFSVTGSEANELAIQFARKQQDAPKVLTRWNSYHGSTYGAGTLTGDPITRNAVESHAAMTGTVKFLPAREHNSPFNADSPEELAEKAASHVEFVIRNEGPDSVAAILIEPVAGSSGGYTAPPGYFEHLREICDEYDVLMIADEVISGFGRCGEMFAVQSEGVAPDMITFAKGATSGYVPLAGVLVRPKIAASLRSGMDVGQTFAGHPLACAAGLAAIEEYEDSLIENVQQLAPVLESELRNLAAKHDVIAAVRGRGFHWGVVVKEPETGVPFKNSWIDDKYSENPLDDVFDVAREHGLLLGRGRPDYQLIVSPPLCVDESEIREAASVLDHAFETVFD